MVSLQIIQKVTEKEGKFVKTKAKFIKFLIKQHISIKCCYSPYGEFYKNTEICQN